jgi:hypothetical protein
MLFLYCPIIPYNKVGLDISRVPYDSRESSNDIIEYNW